MFFGSQEALGLLDSPVPALQSPLLEKIGSEEDHRAALQAARESITLLKNGDMPTRGGEGAEDEGMAKALPLDRSKISKLLLVGPACDSFTLQSGGWTKHWQVREGWPVLCGGLVYAECWPAGCLRGLLLFTWGRKLRLPGFKAR